MKSYRKFIAALVGAAGEATALGLVHGTSVKGIAVAVAFLTALGVYAVPNA